MSELTGGQILQQFIDAYEIPYFFGNPGTTETGILEAITHCKNTQYILGLQESTAIGIAAGYALGTNKPAVVNIHTYPGLANSMCNMYNAYTSGIPMFVIAGQQACKSLIHNPVLSGPLTQLADTATKYAYEVTSADDLSIALQRCYNQAMMLPCGPTFLSIPMDLLKEKSDQAYFKQPHVYQASVDHEGIKILCDLLSKTPKGKLAFIADYESAIAKNVDLIGAVAHYFDAHLYSSPYHVRPVLNPLSPHYTQVLPPSTGDIHTILSKYETVVILGEKAQTFLFTGKPAIPSKVKLIQISSPKHLAFDFPCDLALGGDIDSTLTAIIEKFKIPLPTYTLPDSKAISTELLKNNINDNPFAWAIIKILELADKSTPLITEGSSEDSIVQKFAARFGYLNVFFSPRGGGLGWAMPVATGMSLATKKHSICFAGDGGTLYALHAIWSAARYRIPVVFICFINNEYKILKNLWARFENSDPNDTHYIGMDMKDPEIDMIAIAKGFGAITHTVKSIDEIEPAMKEALKYTGPTFIGVYQ